MSLQKAFLVSGFEEFMRFARGYPQMHEHILQKLQVSDSFLKPVKMNGFRMTSLKSSSLPLSKATS